MVLYLTQYLILHFKKIVFILLLTSLGSLFLIYSLNEYNKSQITPSPSEIELMKKNFGDINIKSKNDIFRVNQIVISKIHHKLNLHYPINISKIITDRAGYCYDRSLILQKIFIYNKIHIRPIFLFFHSDSTDANIFHLFDKDLQSHNIFEFKYEGKWYVMRTNSSMTELTTIEEYLNQSTASNYKYIRYLNNRNSKFIYPGFLPDVYWFN